MAAQLKELVEFIAKGLVEAPEAVSVTGDIERGQFELRVAPDDRGKVIGKKGRTAHAMRTVLAAASEPGAHVSLDIVD